MGDSVGTTVSGEVLASRSTSGRKQLQVDNSLYRVFRGASTPKAHHDPVALEILQARLSQQRHRERALAIQNRIKLLQKQEEISLRVERRKRETQAFYSQVRERRLQDEQLQARIKSEREAAEIESRIRYLRIKRHRVKQINTARSKVLAERREIVEEVRRAEEQFDVEIEARREVEKRRNIDRRRMVERELKQVQEQRTLSARGHRELLKLQYRSRLEAEKQKAEEERRRMEELEKLQETVAGRLRGKSLCTVDGHSPASR